MNKIVKNKIKKKNGVTIKQKYVDIAYVHKLGKV